MFQRKGSRGFDAPVLWALCVLVGCVVCGDAPSARHRMIAKFKYFLRSLSRIAGADRNCPSCQSHPGQMVKRKYTTALYLCPECKLMFRVPKDDPNTAESFYESEYEQGFTTDCSSPEQLEKLKSARFAGTEKNYRCTYPFSRQRESGQE